MSTGAATRGTANFAFDLLIDEECSVSMADFIEMGFHDRGLIRTGMKADMVIFDADTIAEVGTFAAPRRFPVGIQPWIVGCGQ